MHLEKKVRVDSFDLTGTDFREVWSQDGRVPACSDIPPSDSMFVGTISFCVAPATTLLPEFRAPDLCTRSGVQVGPGMDGGFTLQRTVIPK